MPPKARRLVLVTMRTTTAAQAQPQPEVQPIQDDHPHLSLATMRTTTAAQPQPEVQPIQDDHPHPSLVTMRTTTAAQTQPEGRDAGPLPIHHAAAADQPSQNPFVMQLQQAPLAPSHPHNALLSLSFTERLSIDAGVDHVEIEDV
ncbi:hypothetical protein M0R45_032268 [Rubus argutus]|uniref:Uncharacterized protein n=1 Tax=Rubus argutus TaxID=59490 RepID=A0AAW1WG12_RUBAR